jgi:hypothetical protein
MQQKVIDNILLIDNLIFVDWIQLQYSKEVEIKERSEAASSPPLLEYTCNFIPKVIFLPDFLAKESTVMQILAKFSLTLTLNSQSAICAILLNTMVIFSVKVL